MVSMILQSHSLQRSIEYKSFMLTMKKNEILLIIWKGWYVEQFLCLMMEVYMAFGMSIRDIQHNIDCIQPLLIWCTRALGWVRRWVGDLLGILRSHACVMYYYSIMWTFLVTVFSCPCEELWWFHLYERVSFHHGGNTVFINAWNSLLHHHLKNIVVITILYLIQSRYKLQFVGTNVFFYLPMHMAVTVHNNILGLFHEWLITR